MKKFMLIAVPFLTVITFCNHSGRSEIDLSGTWLFMMDPDDAGEGENWFNKDFEETVHLPGSMVENGKGYDINLETQWTGNQKPHTLGILCDPEHPALQNFPTEYHSNWQWWDAMSHADAIRLDGISGEINPVVQIIDNWVTNRKLALIFEARVGEGSILVSGTDLVNNLDTRPEARQLLYSLKKYMSGNDFDPKFELAHADLQAIIK